MFWQEIKRETMDCCDTCKFVKLERYCGGGYEHYCNLDGTYKENRMQEAGNNAGDAPWHREHYHTKEHVCQFYERNEL